MRDPQGWAGLKIMRPEPMARLRRTAGEGEPVEDPYAVQVDWIAGGSLKWPEWKARHGGGLLSWLHWQFGAHDQAEIQDAMHDDLMAEGKPHKFRGVYFGGRP